MAEKTTRRHALKLSGAMALAAAAGCQHTNNIAKSYLGIKDSDHDTWQPRPEDHEFVEKELLVKGVKEKQPWAMSFFSRMNTKRMIVTPALGEMDKMDLLGIKPD